MIFNRYILGCLPAIIICAICFICDKNRKKNIFKYILLFILGMLSCYVTNKIENKVGSFFPEMIDMNWYMVILYALLGVAIYEEGSKWFFTLFVGKNSIGKKEIMFFAIVCSMGFAMFENVVYYLSKGDFTVAIIRMFTAVPSHACNAIIMGYFLTLDKNKRNLLLSLFMPIVVHSIYNALIYKNILIGRVFNLCYYIILLIICLNIYIKVLRSDKNGKKFYGTRVG